jgi:hypothetical protein
MNSRCAGPSSLHHLPRPDPTRPSLWQEFNPALAGCRYRAPLPPRLARPSLIDKYGGEGGIRTHEAENFRLPALQAGAFDQTQPPLHAVQRNSINQVGGESEIRTHEAGNHLLAFEASAFDQLGHLSTQNLYSFFLPSLRLLLRRPRKKSRSTCPHSEANTPGITSSR